jgi:hypothetical protein
VQGLALEQQLLELVQELEQQPWELELELEQLLEPRWHRRNLALL